LLGEVGERGKIKSTAASSWLRVSMSARITVTTEPTRGGARAMTANEVSMLMPIFSRSFKSLHVRRSFVHHAAMTTTGTRGRILINRLYVFFLYVQDGRTSRIFLQILVAVASDAIEAGCMPPTQWLREHSRDSRIRTHRATTIANLHPLGTPGPRQPHNPDMRVPFHHSTNLINMPQVGMFRNEDGSLRTPQWNCTLSGSPLVPEVHPYETEVGLPQIFTPWSENETQLMHRIFPNPDSLCLNFGRTGVFQWDNPNSSIMTQTTEWPQRVAGHTLRSCELAGLTQTWMEPHPHMPYVIFRDMGPHFDSYANSGIPDIIGTNLELHCCENEQRCQLLYLLPHLQLIDVGTDLEHRLGDLHTLTKLIDVAFITS